MWINVGAFKGHRWAICNKEHHKKCQSLIYGAFIFKAWTPLFSFLEFVTFVSNFYVFLGSKPFATNGENINVTKSTKKHGGNGISHLHNLWDPRHLLGWQGQDQ